MPTENTTSFAVAFESATILLLDGLANPEGEIFQFAHGEALAAAYSAHDDMERELAQTLARSIRAVAITHGKRVKT